MAELIFDYKPGTLITRRDLLKMAASLLARPGDPTPKIVDIGCAIGDMFGNKAVNVDIKSLDEMKAEAKPCHGDIEIPNYIQADAENLPFKDKEFDVAVLSEILEHIANPVAAICEARRVARFVIICVPNEYLWSPDKNPFAPYEQSGHIRRFTSAILHDTVMESGIEVLEYMDWQYLGWAYFIVIGR